MNKPSFEFPLRSVGENKTLAKFSMDTVFLRVSVCINMFVNMIETKK